AAMPSKAAREMEPSPEPGPLSSAAAPAAGASAARAGAAPSPNALRPFAEVIKDAKRIDGLFTLWQKDDKVWLELKPSDFNQPFFLSPKLKTGIGESHFYGGLLGDAFVI